MKHRTIPFFIPHEGCPFTCVFCSQKKISGASHGPSAEDISRTISKYLKTIPKNNIRREVAFFGGSFTGLPVNKQEEYLKAVQPFIARRAIHGIRVSTRPDYIDRTILEMLKKYHVSCIELGVQSLSDDVLAASKRGHTVADVRRSSKLIREYGFTLGHQIMVGLPKSTPAKELKTARMSIAMKASEVRIYPVLVIRGTGLAAMWRRRAYKPLTEAQAITRSARLVETFNKKGVLVLRCGLHPSEGLLTGRDILSGPFHQAFGQKVEAHLYGEILEKFLKKLKKPSSIRHVLFNPTDGASVIGYKRENAERAERRLKTRKIFTSSGTVPKGSIMVEYMDGKIKMIGRL